MGQSTMSNKDITDIDMVIRTLEVEKLKLVKPDPSELHKLKANLDMLKVQSDAIEHARVCQSCLRPFEEKDIQAQIDKKKVEMDEILARGGQLREEYNALSNAYEVGTSSLNTRIEELRARRMKTQNEITFANSGSVDDFNSRMKAWEHNKAEFLSKLGKEEQDYRDQQTGLQSYNNAVDRLNDLKKEDKELVKSLESHDLANLEIIKEALSPKGVTFKEIELKIVEIMKYFPEGFTIELLKKNKSNDEFKKVFNVSLDGVGYKWLSKGMKKLVDIRFANLISDKK